MIRKSIGKITVLSFLGLALTQPSFAAGPTRSADALPIVVTSVGTVAYRQGMEAEWSCSRITDETLGLERQYVRVDQAGNVILDPQNAPIACTPAAAERAGRGGSAWPVIAGLALAGGGAAALSGNDSPN